MQHGGLSAPVSFSHEHRHPVDYSFIHHLLSPCISLSLSVQQFVGRLCVLRTGTVIIRIARGTSSGKLLFCSLRDDWWRWQMITSLGIQRNPAGPAVSETQCSLPSSMFPHSSLVCKICALSIKTHCSQSACNLRRAVPLGRNYGGVTLPSPLQRDKGEWHEDKQW